MSEVSGKTFDAPLLKRVLKYVKPYLNIFYGTTIFAILIAFLSPARPILIQYAFDNYITTPNEDKLLLITIFLVGLLFAESVLQYFYTYWSNFLGQSVIRDLRLQSYKKIINFKQQYFDKNPIGALVTRVVSDIETISDIFSQGLLVIIADILKLIIVIIVMFVTDWRLALFSLASIPLLLIATYWFKRSIKSAFQEVRKQVSALNTFVQEHIVGMYIVQLFNREDIEFEKFKTINKRHKKAHVRSIWYYSVFFPIVEILSAISIGLLIWWGGIEAVITNEVTLGELIAFILYIHMLFRPIRQLADRFNVLQMGMVASERVFKVLDTDDSISNLGKMSLDNCIGDIEFKNVWFAYNDEDWVLKDVSFKVTAGETLALVGATGAGKSSIINLLTRNYEINKGSILIDGVNYLKYDLNSLRKNIAVVLQDVFLFSDTIYNNIILGRDISLDRVKAYAKDIEIDDFIQSLPNAYHYNVRERGGMLSLGQRQLISFVRAYVNQPKILVLDEATSSIDSESESLIQRSSEKLTKDRTSIVIAHRLATIQNADTIILLENGKLIEEGSHQDLLSKNGKYKLLYDLQFQK
ncbi:ABC transporter ATP-binding protein/permease [Flavobacteriales bacterium]|nr:ABC transporter ATP-binding protein/permease [Flavobacteriales bacterium]